MCSITAGHKERLNTVDREYNIDTEHLSIIHLNVLHSCNLISGAVCIKTIIFTKIPRNVYESEWINVMCFFVRFKKVQKMNDVSTHIDDAPYI